MTNPKPITNAERKEAMLQGGDASMATVHAYEARLQQLEEAYAAAENYIAETPCDPDIYDDQIAAFNRLQKARAAIAKAKTGDPE